MNEKYNILIIDLHEESNRTIQSIVSHIPTIDVISEMEDLTQGYEQIQSVNPFLVLLHLYPDPEQTLRIARKITQNYPEITLFVTSRNSDSELIIDAMRCGAREYLIQPIRQEELVTSIQKMLAQYRAMQSDNPQKNKIITCFGAKGGVGTTTVATNSATALAEHTHKEVMVLDLNLQLGTATVMLDSKPKCSILDVANNITSIDIPVLKNMLSTNIENVSTIGGPPKIEDADAISGEHVDRIIQLFRSIYNYIIIDTAPVFNDVTIKALDESDHILLITTLDVPSIVNAKRCLEVFYRMGYDEDKVLLVINRHGANGDLNIPAMEKLLDHAIYWRFPDHDDKSIHQAVNKGTPISQMQPTSKLGQNFMKLVHNFNGHIAPEEVKKSSKLKTPILSKLIRS